MIISIKNTEEIIKQLLDPTIISVEYSVPAYRLNIYPGELVDLGKPISCNHVQVKFKNIDFENYKNLKFSQVCIGQINEVYFEVLVQSNNLRAHTEVYEIASAIVTKLRGACVLAGNDSTLLENQAPIQIAKYTFDKVDNGGACYQSTIDVMSSYADTYKTTKFA